MFGFRVPIISLVIGEGGSGGALAIGCANRSLIMEHSVYYVASPEACAAILWKSRDKANTVSNTCHSKSVGFLHDQIQQNDLSSIFQTKVSQTLTSAIASSWLRGMHHPQLQFQFSSYTLTPSFCHSFTPCMDKIAAARHWSGLHHVLGCCDKMHELSGYE